MAGWQHSQLRDELKAIMGNRSTDVIANTRYTLWLNLCQVELLSAFQFFQAEKRATAAMIVAQATYVLPTDCLAIYDIRDNTLKRKIRRTHYRKLDNMDYTASGNPTHYIRFGGCIQLYPVPSAANTMQMRYCKEVTLMSADADYPTVPQPWHECLILGAEWRGWRSLGEVSKALVAKNEYLAMVRSRNSEWDIEESDEEFGIELMR